MAGLHFACGDWMGEDKSGDPLFDIIPDELYSFVTREEEHAWRDEFLGPFNRQAEATQLTLTPEMMRAIVGPLRRYQSALLMRLGTSDPDSELSPEQSDDVERFECVRDLLRGDEVCQRTGKPIVVYFA